MRTFIRGLRGLPGYSLLEVMMVLGVMGVVSSIALVQIGNARPAMKGNGAMRVVMSEVTQARETAISQRRYVQINFINNSEVQLVRQEVPAANGTTVLADIPLEGGVVFTLLAGIGDTPDAFGASKAVDFGSATSVMFNTDGMLIDNTGATVNGTVYMAMPSQPQSYRAVTILGSTGRIRGYRWDGGKWVLQ